MYRVLFGSESVVCFGFAFGLYALVLMQWVRIHIITVGPYVYEQPLYDIASDFMFHSCCVFPSVYNGHKARLNMCYWPLFKNKMFGMVYFSHLKTKVSGLMLARPVSSLVSIHFYADTHLCAGLELVLSHI